VLHGEWENRAATLGEVRGITPDCLRMLVGVARQLEYPIGVVLSDVYGDDAPDLEAEPSSIKDLQESLRRLLDRLGAGGSGGASLWPGG
jgi:hypothetical protein